MLNNDMSVKRYVDPVQPLWVNETQEGKKPGGRRGLVVRSRIE